ncbi:Bis(5'-nucleosyl)-tetraphosphatase PrpE [asymmetrical] [Gracilariopsis chorda]|uniref:Bis(5'-nucleosyl)-tetraphosphatase PrpE [asymmetrical] n=1 Tax=Gracilariopsis chorda TaxID=448386 RepID=A0A2V3ICM1_9FLOR|nr:Bis(5'-nucleosyl)-tetraphosphatase PrpE [asymmetrical] [Gracilariopsis chorda]|eukprot:PXF39835.1 Bis(5'-nucleosyl)-tetraphosphatase PrpE [asymmetrical] [Gracilariopsis chorda]
MRFSPTSTAPHQHAPSVKQQQQQQQQLISPINRALGISPRLIVVGDVHGCIHELQQLLRLADYAPGDQVIFLGDLVAKGPDSPSVVQLAREIGAKTVRGNHDYEVIRFWEARRRGDHAIVSPEHAAIAAKLSTADVRFLGDAPWFIEAADMKHLFVHAGFIPRVKLTQQNPRLMMNMRSVLKDGTVTAKSVVGYEWAKLWQGPHTVVFGHDACRGLQHFQYARGIDTGCVYGGRLTALLLPENRLISVAAKRAYVSPRKLRTVLCDQ